MVIIAEVSVPASAFHLGEVLDEHQGWQIQFEQVVALGDSTLPPFWFKGGDASRFEASIEEDSNVRSIRRLVETDERTLFEVQWGEFDDTILGIIQQENVTILKATGRGGTWDLRLQFPAHEALSRFSTETTERGIPLTLHRLHEPGERDQTAISTEQREAIALAYRKGYFEVPRCTTIDEMATDLGISGGALSQRLRRGMAQIVVSQLHDAD